MADRYWVGGTGTWNTTSTTNWSATSGGAGGASVPTSADDVFFNASSGTGTVTIGATVSCRSLNATGASTLTIAGTSQLSVFGSFTLPATNLSWTHTGVLAFEGTSVGSAKNITTNGVTITSAVTFGSTTGTDAFVLQDAFTCTAAVTHTFGTLNLNNFTLTVLTFASSNSNTRALAFGTSGIIALSGTGTVWNTGTLTGFTTSGTSNVRLLSAGSTAITITAGSTTSAQALNFAVTAGTYALTLTAGSNMRNLNFTGFAGSFTLGGAVSLYGDLTLSSTTTSTSVAQTLSFAGTGTPIQNFTSAGRTIGCSLNISGSASVKLIDAITQNTARSFSLSASTFDMNSQTVNVGILTINTGTKSILNGTINCASVSHASGDLTVTSTATVVTTGTYTLNAGSLTLGANSTLTIGSFSSTSITVRSIAFGTSSSIVVTGTGAAWTATQTSGFFTYTGTSDIRFTYSGAAAMTVNMAGTTTAQAMNFSFTAGTYSLTLSTGSVFNNLNFTGFSGTYAQASTTATVFGNLTFSSTMATTASSGSAGITMGATSGTRTITTNGNTITTNITFNGVGGTFQLADNFSQGGLATFGVNNGTIDFNNKTYSLGTLNFNTAAANYTLQNYGSILSAGAININAALTIGSGLNITTPGRITITSVVLTIANGITLTAGSVTVQSASSGIAFGTGAIELTGSGVLWDSSLGSPSFSGSQIVRVIYSGSVSSSMLTGTSSRLNFYFTAGTYALNMSSVAGVGNLDFTGFSGSLTNTSVTTSVYGDIVFSSTMTTSINVTFNMLGAGTRTITSNGMVYQGSFNFNSSGATFRLVDNFSQSSTGAFTLTNGTIDFNNVTYTLGVLTFVSGSWSYINFGSVLNPPAAITLTSGTLSVGSGSAYLQTAGAFTFTAGTLNINDGVTFNVGSFSSSNTNTRVINFSAGSDIQTNGTGTVINAATTTGFSFTGTSLIVVSNPTSTACTISITGNATSAMNISVVNGTYTLTISAGNHYRTLDFTGFTGTLAMGTSTHTVWGDLILGSGMTTTGTTGTTHFGFSATSGTRTITGNGVTANFGINLSGVGQTLRLGGAFVQGTGHVFNYLNGTFDTAGYSTSLGTLVVVSGTHAITGGTINCSAVTHSTGDLTIGSAATVVCSGTYTFTAGTITINDGVTLSVGAFTSSNSNVRSVAFGTGKIDLTGSGTVWNLATPTNFGYTGLALVRLVNSGSVATTVTSPLTALNFDVTAGTYSLTLTSGCVFQNLNFTGFSGTWAQAATTQTILGNLTYSSTMTATNTSGTISFTGTGNSTIRSNGLTSNAIRHVINKGSSTASVTLADAFTGTNPFTLTAGVFDTANYSFTSLSFVSTGASARTMTMGSSAVTLTGSGTVWNVDSVLTVSSSTSTINLSSASAKTFAGAGKVYYNLYQTGAGALTITGSNTFNALATPVTTTSATTVNLTAGTTTTVSDLSLFNGTLGRLLTLQSTVAGSAATISDASGTITVSYVSIRDSIATGGATFKAPLNLGNVNVSNNTGWDFSNIVIVSGVNTNFFAFF